MEFSTYTGGPRQDPEIGRRGQRHSSTVNERTFVQLLGNDKNKSSILSVLKNWRREQSSPSFSPS